MPKPRVITEQEDFPIKPSDINAAEHMRDAFGNMETETSAGYIVRLLQKKGNWIPFTYSELNAFYRKTCKGSYVDSYIFHHLLGAFRVMSIHGNHCDRLDVVVREGDEKNDGHNIQDDDVFRVTDQFVLRCYAAAGIRRRKQVLQSTV